MATLSQANANPNEEQLVPIGYDFEGYKVIKKSALVVYLEPADFKVPAEIEEEPEAEKETTSWFTTAKNVAYSAGKSFYNIDFYNIGYGIANLGYTLGTSIAGIVPMAFGASEVLYGMALGAYGTCAGGDKASYDNGKSWTEAGFKNVSYGADNVKKGVMNIPNTASYFYNAIPQIS